jgi:hypothetical protein
MNERPIYAVYATHVDRNYLLGYCISDERQDINAYYDEEKGYGLEVERVAPIVIPSGYAVQKKELVRQREVLKKQLEEIDRKIKVMK